MTKTTTPAALERLEGVAADLLEDMIAKVEKEEDIKVKDIEVALIPDPKGDSPAVTVIVSTA